MACDVRVLTAGPMPVWSDKTQDPSDGNFVHMTSFISAAEVERVRVSIELRSNSGAAQVLPAFQVANEETSPGNVFDVDATISWNATDGWTYGSAFFDISADLVGQQLVRFGLRVRNTGGSNTEIVLAVIRVEIQARA